MQRDLSYILDPSYSTKHSTQPRIYVDRKGNMHDPDYRFFPAVSTSSNSPPSSYEEEYIDPFSSPSSSSRRLSTSTTASPFYPTPPPPIPSSQSHSILSCSDARKQRKSPRRVSLDSYQADEEEDYGSDDDYSSELDEEAEHKSRVHGSVKKEFQSIALSMSIGVFRARRKVKNALRR